MNNQATSIGLFFEKTASRNTTTSKLLKLNTLDKTVFVIYTLQLQIMASIALVLFILPMHIGWIKCFPGFCCDDKANSKLNENRQ